VGESEIVSEFIARGFEQKLMVLYEDFKSGWRMQFRLSRRATWNKHLGSL